MNIQERFENFNADNPQVYTTICAMARSWVAKGNSNLGIGMVFEVMRWDHAMRTQGDPFKLNNDYRSRYVRLIEENELDLVGVFRKRTLTQL